MNHSIIQNRNCKNSIPKPGESLSSYFICECRDTNSSSSAGKPSTTSSCLAVLRGGGSAAGACPLVLRTELFGTPSESLRFFAAAGGGGTGTGALSPLVTPLAVAGVRTRPASRSTLGGGVVIGPESVTLVSPESLGLKPVFLAQEEGGMGLGSGGDGACRLRLLGLELDIFGISYA